MEGVIPQWVVEMKVLLLQVPLNTLHHLGPHCVHAAAPVAWPNTCVAWGPD